MIFQTTKSHKVDSNVFDNYIVNVRNNPDFEFRYFDDRECSDYMNRVVTPVLPHVTQAYHALTIGAYRSDVWRLCVLYFEGGYYLDINKTLTVNMSTIFRRIPQVGNVYCSRHYSFQNLPGLYRSQKGPPLAQITP